MIKKILLLLVFISLVLAGSGWWLIQPVDQQAETSQVFIIKKGEAVGSIGQRLKQADLIKNTTVFKLVVLIQGINDQIQAGSFDLSTSLSLLDLTQELTKGRSDFWLTVPEGWRVEEIGARLFELTNGQFNQDEFVSLTKPLEGQLFPDTYLLPLEVSPKQVVALMNNNFKQKTSDLKNRTNLTESEVIVLASLVEREAKTNYDRPLIAGILLKRLANDWPLQVDATVQYILGYQTQEGDWWKSELTKADLAIQSKFNTYLNQGLPPQPICNPGLASLEAAYQPEASDYWFYLAEPNGQTHFAETAEEHNFNIQTYLTN